MLSLRNCTRQKKKRGNSDVAVFSASHRKLFSEYVSRMQVRHKASKSHQPHDLCNQESITSIKMERMYNRSIKTSDAPHMT